MALFPSLCPTERSFRAAQWPVKSVESLSGVTSRRLFGDRPSAATLELRFTNIPDADAALVEQNHRDCLGDVNRVDFPGTVFSGMDPTLAGRVASPGAGLFWHWDGPPDITSVFPGVSDVRCRFRATQDR